MMIQIKRTEQVAMYQNNITKVVEVFRIQPIRANHIDFEMYPIRDYFGTTAFQFPDLTPEAELLYTRLN